jgi:hypothetical protein
MARFCCSCTRFLSGALNEAQGANIASATTTDIGAATGNSLTVTGTTTITGLGTVQAGARRIVTFSGILILTHNATSLILPTAANITTQAGDVVTFISLGSGNWRCSSYTRADGTPLAGGGGGGASEATLASVQDSATTVSTTYVSPRRFWSGITQFLTQAWTFSNANAAATLQCPVVAYAALPSATYAAGLRAFVNDSTVISFGDPVLGGASNTVPCWSDGTVWRVG